MAKRNKLTLDFTGIERLVKKLDKAGADVEKAGTDALLEAAEKVQTDVRAALEPGNLPAGGRYSTGDTEAAIIEPHVEQTPEGLVAYVGFDKTVPGAGGYLIGGTPTMRPDPALHKMFAEPEYMQKLVKGMEDSLLRAYGEAMK